MAKKTKQTKSDGKEEVKKTTSVSTKVRKHYDDAKAELDSRITHKERGLDVYHKLYRNYIDPSFWPFSARVPDGRGASLIDRKTDRILANKLSGRFVSTKYGTDLGAKVASQLVMHYWNKIDLTTDTPMLVRWRMMDSRARRFGASFGRWSWRTVRDAKGNMQYSCPWFDPWENKNVLTQPGATSEEQSDYLILRDYVTLYQLKRINNLAKTGPIYDPDVIQKLEEMRKGKNTSDHISIDKTVLGLDDTSNEKIEICTEYNQELDKWITYTPNAGMGTKEAWILKEIDNPYPNLPTIPVVRLSYYPVDDDIYGKPELEAVLPLIKADWALFSQTLEQAQNELYTPLQVNPTETQLDTLQFKSGARWLVQKPGQSVVPYIGNNTVLQKFGQIDGLLSARIMEGVGETAQDVSNLSQTYADKTATEVRDMALLRTARDSANKVILQQSIARMVNAWLKMSQTMMTDSEIIQVVGRDALQHFINERLHEWSLSDDGARMVADYVAENNEVISNIASDTGREPFEIGYEALRATGALDEHAVPLNPKVAEGQQIPQLRIEKDQKSGYLTVDKSDIAGDYSYVVDIEAMGISNDQTDIAARQMFFDASQKVERQLSKQGYQIKWKELLEKMGETAKLRDADQYFEKVLPEQMQEGGAVENVQTVEPGI